MRAFLLAAALCVPMTAHAAVLTDSIAEDLALAKDYAQSLKTWILQNTQALSEANTEINTAKTYLQEVESYIAFVQNPSLGEADVLLRGTGLTSDLPADPLQVAQLASGFGSMGGGGLSGLLSRLAMINTYSSSAYTTNHVYTCAGTDAACQDLNARSNGIAGAMGMAQAGYADIQAHNPVIPGLRSALEGETTPAKRETIMAQLLAEQAWSQNMNVSAAQANAQAVLAAEAARQRILERQRQSADQLLANTQPVTGVMGGNVVAAADIPSPYPTAGQ